MTPIFKIEANGKDVTEQLKKDISSISFSDEDGNQSDEITIRVAGNFQRPKYQDEIKLWLGYKESKLFYCGLFLVQTTERDRFGLTITATGADFSETLKQKRDLSYESISLKKLVKTIALRNKLDVKSDFDDMELTHISQTNESDLHFLKRLSQDYNAIFSIKNNTLVFLKRIKDSQKSSTLPLFEIDAAECSEGTPKIKHMNRTLYASCTASWHDTADNQVKKITVGNGDPVLKLAGSFKTHAEAKSKAEAKLMQSARGTKAGHIAMPGREIYAGSSLKLTGAGEDSGEYSIKSVNHTYSDGWSMTIEIEN